MKSACLLLLLLGFVLLLPGCISTWQTSNPESITPTSYATYQSSLARTAGRLRRQFLVTVSFPLPKICAGGSGGDMKAEFESNFANDILEDVKGYELVRSKGPESRKIGESASDLTAALGKLIDAAQQGADTISSENVAPAVRQIVRDRGADGVLLVEIRHTCGMAETGWRTALAIVSLGLNELRPDPATKLGYFWYRATMFEAVSGRIVWQTVIANESALYSWSGDRRDYREALFGNLEPAVPALLTK